MMLPFFFFFFRFLLRKLLHYQSVGEGPPTPARPLTAGILRSPPEDTVTGEVLI